ncbi:hypothetical protein B0H67DRAFT_492079 [Lasiosphaeris hirsuta]|uniref:Uncharacterized protein n=1 Tax=Lasiosphaeris hirsuta TaxID=260670 RepID=A0AA40DU04_9PEZI|nr:hypothetical protein B0H67DRAFT_492079 [Lasiosphaeris hirsuta]
MVSVATLASSAFASQLSKRCSPARDPEVAHGYYPPAPCWQDFDTACRPYIAEGTEMTLDTKHKLAVIYGVSEYCAAEVAEELARSTDGRKNYGWAGKHGNLTLIKGGILIISGMPEDAVTRYSKLTYQRSQQPAQP